jgi:transposase-like protein
MQIANKSGLWNFLAVLVLVGAAYLAWPSILATIVDSLLSENRDQAAAVRFFKKAVGNNEAPEKITLDGSRASHQAVAELKAEGVLPAQTLVRTNKYLNNMIEQDHRKAPQRCYPILGFKTFGNAEVTLGGIELANKIKKGQFDTSEIINSGAMILQV